MTQAPDNPRKEILVFYTILVLLVNIAGCIKAFNSGGWAQLGLIAFLAPVYDGLFLLIGIIMMARLSKKYPADDYGLYWLAVTALPIVMYVATVLFTFAYSKGGC